MLLDTGRSFLPAVSHLQALGLNLAYLAETSATGQGMN